MRIKTKLWQQIVVIDDYSVLEGKIDFTQFNSKTYPAILAKLRAKEDLTYEEKLLRDVLDYKLSIQSSDRKNSDTVKELDTKCTLIIKHLLKGLI